MADAILAEWVDHGTIDRTQALRLLSGRSVDSATNAIRGAVSRTRFPPDTEVDELVHLWSQIAADFEVERRKGQAGGTVIAPQHVSHASGPAPRSPPANAQLPAR